MIPTGLSVLCFIQQRGRMTERMWNNHEMRSSYDVVIIGGGAHGLATAYYLAKTMVSPTSHHRAEVHRLWGLEEIPQS